eukprot:m.11977 g.11977  ORF g.11977 m.11977 type:complete len:155 (+) comp9890_c0_seq4:1630-2094(+)
MRYVLPVMGCCCSFLVFFFNWCERHANHSLTIGVSRVVYRMNSLTSLPADLFRDTTALETLNMDFNIQLTELPAGLLNGLSALTSLRFEGLRIATLPAGLFDDTPLTVLFNPRGVNFDCCDVDTYTQLVDFQDNVNVRCVNPAPGPVPAERPLC